MFRIDATGKAFVLLDSPFKEIHALRVAADGTIYAAAMNGAGRRAGRAPTADRTAEPTARAGADASRPRSPTVGVVDARPARRAGRDAVDAGRGATANGRDLPHPPRRPLGHAVGDRRRCAVRLADRAGRQRCWSAPARRARSSA